ncbi:uncharacterized protein LOC130821429 [Amaranthus tricolor]|uniref:uncharacterized protein LOC130821429 n=1 Tax=Amaranthus tricolor TaxID=29722 RepID=UPI00258D86AD|nr:uncharacterized protein LOC130821429 [Amaranthus tricolor]
MEIEVDYVNEESTKENIVLRSRLQSQPQPQYSLAFLESLTMPQVQEVVLSADVRCIECQKRIGDMISRFNETESVVVNLLEKKVVITCKGLLKPPKKHIMKRQKDGFNKIALIKWMFGSSNT